MIFSVGMKKVDLLILKTDIDAVLEYLGKSSCFQVSDKVAGELSEKHRECEELLRKLEAAGKFLEVGESSAGDVPVRVPRNGDFAEIDGMLAGIGELVEREKGVEQHRLRLLHTLEEVGIFRRLGLPLKELETVTYLSYRLGTVKPDKRDALREALGTRALILDLDETGRIFAVASKKGRFALDTELKKFDFRDTPFPTEAADMPPEILSGLENELEKARRDILACTEKKDLLKQMYETRIREYTAILRAGCVVEELKDHLQSTESSVKLSGWLPVDGLEETLRGLEKVTGDRIAIRVYEAEEVESVIQGKEKIPVKLKHGRFVRSFNDIVFSYGAPLYGTIDPTPLVSVFFVLLFAVMFGDVGQGLVGVLAGVVLEREMIPALKKWKKYAPIFLTVGAASMVTGFLYGSVFADEEALVPLTRALTRAMTGRPLDRFIPLLPSNGIGKLAAFFGFTLGVGFLINSIGIVINMYNRFKLKDYRRAIFSKTGAAGAFLFWYAASMAVRAVAGSLPGTADFIVLSVPVLLLFWGEPLYNLASGRRPLFPEGVFSFVMEGLVEVMESVSYFISNSVSFLRVGAFALSHAVLSLIVFQMAELISTVPGGGFLRLLVILAGNVLIIVLEGLIVSIQVIRLQYYEFFSKFFTETGTEFDPFELSAPRR